MEDKQEKQFETVIKKSVAMYTMLTGKPMSEREGRAFIEIFDMAEAYVASGTDIGSATETFDILSQVELRGPTDAEQRQRIAELVKNPPQFVGREPEPAKTATFAEAVAHGPSWPHVSPPSQDGDKQNEIDAAWDARDREQVEESGRIEQERTTREASEKANRIVTTTDRSKHAVGYDWQICALCRVGARDNSIIRCFKSEPTPDEFFELYRLYDAHSHWVFVNRWNDGAQRWDKYLDQYLQEHEKAIRNLRGTLPPRVLKVSKDPDEKRGRDVSAPPVSAAWEQDDKPWRIRYYSDVAGEVIFAYVDKRPTAAEMAHFHHSKCMAVSQAKPKQAA